MHERHALAIQRIKEAYETDPEVLALIIGGSVAKGWAAESSDVDCMLVVADEVYERKKAAERLTVFRTDLTDYEGGYTDGKIVPLRFLKLVAQKGSEPARSAFLGALIQFDHTGEVESLVKKILVYPEDGVEDRIRRFHSQIMIWSWFTGEAAKRNDPYLMSRAVTEISLFTMRLILADNRCIYPYHKWVTRMVEEAPNKPEGILPLLHAMLKSQTVESVEAVMAAFHAWHGAEIDFGEHCHHFLQDSEWNWIDHPAPIGDL